MWKMRSFNICTLLSLFIITNMLSNYLVSIVHLSYNHIMLLLFKNMMVEALFRRALYTVHKWHTAALLKVQLWILLILKVIYTTYPKEIPVQLFARCLRPATILKREYLRKYTLLRHRHYLSHSWYSMVAGRKHLANNCTGISFGYVVYMILRINNTYSSKFKSVTVFQMGTACSAHIKNLWFTTFCCYNIIKLSKDWWTSQSKLIWQYVYV